MNVKMNNISDVEDFLFPFLSNMRTIKTCKIELSCDLCKLCLHKPHFKYARGKSIKKLILFTSFLLFFVIPSLAQTIKGKVIDIENQPIEFASVALFNTLDSTLLAGTITNEHGDFSIREIESTGAFLKISFIGYETKIVPAISGHTIVLNKDNVLLSEVLVKGNIPRIEIKDDALVTTVQNTVLSKAGTGNDVLKKLPSLTGDNGVFSVFGKGEAKIYINNREMRDISELDNLNSLDIRSVEVVSNPGAQYDASIKAIIRINTVPKAGDGFSFDLRSTYYQSQNVDLREQLNVNYRKNGWDVFGTFSYTLDESIQDSELWQKTYVDTLWTQNNALLIDGRNNNYNGVTGINYELSSEHYVGVKYTITTSPQNKWYTEMKSTVLANNLFYDEWSSFENKMNTSKPTHRLNAYYNGALRKLNVDFNADFYTTQEVSISSVTERSQEYDDRLIDSKNYVHNQLLAFKLNLSYPLSGGQVLGGGEYTNTHRKDEYVNTQNIVPSSQTTIEEQSLALFAEYSRLISVLQVKTGLRYENVRSNYLVNDIRNNEQSRGYQQWFPNISVSTKIEDVGLQLSYTVKTRRPSYRQLSSNVTYANRFLMQTGNPYLKPATIHDITLVASWRFIQFMMSYKDEKNVVIYWTEQDKKNSAVSILAYRNLEKMPNLSVFASLSPTIGIWSPQLGVGIMKQWVTILTAEKPIKLNKPLPILTFNNSLQLQKNFVFMLDAQYIGEGDVQNIHLIKNSVVINTSVTKSFLNDRLNLSLKVNDLFYQSKDGNLLYNDQMELYQMNRTDSRELEFTVRYRFNTPKNKYKGVDAGESEIDRL